MMKDLLELTQFKELEDIDKTIQFLTKGEYSDWYNPKFIRPKPDFSIGEKIDDGLIGIEFIAELCYSDIFRDTTGVFGNIIKKLIPIKILSKEKDNKYFIFIKNPDNNVKDDRFRTRFVYWDSFELNCWKIIKNITFKYKGIKEKEIQDKKEKFIEFFNELRKDKSPYWDYKSIGIESINDYIQRDNIIKTKTLQSIKSQGNDNVFIHDLYIKSFYPINSIKINNCSKKLNINTYKIYNPDNDPWIIPSEEEINNIVDINNYSYNPRFITIINI